MNLEQKNQIKELRIKGLGYKAIAGKLNLSRDSIRSFCKRNKLDGFAAIVNMNADIALAGKCKYCSRIISQKSKARQRIFCSEECRRNWWKEHPEMKNKKPSAIYKMTCANCGREFESYGNKNRKYCGLSCYAAHRFHSIKENI